MEIPQLPLGYVPDKQNTISLQLFLIRCYTPRTPFQGKNSASAPYNNFHLNEIIEIN